MEFPREMLKDQLHCLKIQKKTFVMYISWYNLTSNLRTKTWYMVMYTSDCTQLLYIG
jgi:hypothetical protein